MGSENSVLPGTPENQEAAKFTSRRSENGQHETALGGGVTVELRTRSVSLVGPLPA